MRKTPVELSEGPQKPAGVLTQDRVIPITRNKRAQWAQWVRGTLEGTMGAGNFRSYLLDCSGETVSRPLKK